MQKLGKNFVIYDGKRAILHTCNGMADFILNKLKKGSTDKEILRVILNEYDISEKQASNDLRFFLTKLQEKKIIG